MKYTINDLERLTNVKKHTIRIWEKRYGIIQPQRTHTNIRYYNDADVRLLINIAYLNKIGHKISVLAKKTEAEITKDIQESAINNKNEAWLTLFLNGIIDLNEQKMNELLERYLMKISFEQVITEMFYPLLEHIGLMWQISKINPAQEHFASNFIRNKVISEIDKLDCNYKANKTFVLFLREEEYHELGLLFAHYLIKKTGFRVLYLGQSVPISDLNEIKDALLNPIFLTSFINRNIKQDVPSYLKELSKTIAESNIWVMGSLTEMLEENKTITVLKNPNHLKQLLI